MSEHVTPKRTYFAIWAAQYAIQDGGVVGDMSHQTFSTRCRIHRSPGARAGRILPVRAIGQAFTLRQIPQMSCRRNIRTRTCGVAAACIARWPVPLVEVRGIRRVRPGVSVNAHLSVAVKVVQDHILLRQGMLVRCHLLSEDGQFGISIRVRQIPKLLIIGAVLFDDVDDVAERRIASRRGPVLPVIRGDNPLGEASQLRRRH